MMLSRHIFGLLVVLSSFAWAAPTVHKSGEEYTVIFDSQHPAPPEVASVLDQLSLSPSHPDVHRIYNNSAFRGFTASMQSHCLDILDKMSEVKIVEKPVTVSSSLLITARLDAPWGLQRISTAKTVSGGNHDLNFTYSYADNALGANADIYIVDTGIYTKHLAFTGRARMAWSLNDDLTDHEGHGTHVAGIAGGAGLGVASSANIIGVKALDSNGNGSSSNVIGAIDYVIKSHEARKTSQNFTGSVISMSLEAGGISSAITQVLSAAHAAGVHVVVAAGNSGDDACKYSPAVSGGLRGSAITVGSVGMTAQVSSFSNTGACVDVYAPGENVVSAWNTGPDIIRSLDGTSMATPHVTGIVAYAMAGNKTLAQNPDLMKEWVRMTALRNVVQGKVGVGDEMLLANNGIPAGPRPDAGGYIGSKW